MLIVFLIEKDLETNYKVQFQFRKHHLQSHYETMQFKKPSKHSSYFEKQETELRGQILTCYFSPALPLPMVLQFSISIFSKKFQSMASTFQLYSQTLKSKGLAQKCKIKSQSIKIFYYLSSSAAWLSLKVNRIICMFGKMSNKPWAIQKIHNPYYNEEKISIFPDYGKFMM